MAKTLDQTLERWFVMSPEREGNLKDWSAVGNDDDGIIAYFFDEKAAYRFRLAEINRELNG